MNVEATSRLAKEIMDPSIAMIYFVPEGPVQYERVGLKPQGLQPYLCSRSAAFGVVPGEVVAATFYNFNPAMVIPAVNEGWQLTTPERVTVARNRAVTEALTRLWQNEDGSLPEVSRAIERVKKATSCLKPDGRPLFAAHQGRPWPEDNELLSLWWGMNLLREYRGDGHIAALLANDISGLEALLMAAAWSPTVSLKLLLRTRSWSQEQAAEASAGLEARGLIQEGALTVKGRELREKIEDTTDTLAVAPWEKLGDYALEFLNLVKPLSKQVLERGGLGSFRQPARTV